MIFTPHILVGAVIGAKTKKPLLIIILGLLFHFILDRIPHWDYPLVFIENFFTINNKNLIFTDILKILIDIFVGLFIVFLILKRKKMLNKDYVPYVVLGIVVSLLPDLLWSISAFIKSDAFVQFTNFHDSIHYVTQKEGAITFLGVFTQIIVVIISLLLLFFF